MSFYCEKHVGKGRKVKWCCKCGNTIGIGESSYSIPGENFETTNDMCIPCYDECEKAGINDISNVKMYDEDDDEEENEMSKEDIIDLLKAGDENTPGVFLIRTTNPNPKARLTDGYYRFGLSRNEALGQDVLMLVSPHVDLGIEHIIEEFEEGKVTIELIEGAV